jgi:hypothetical protein
MGVAKVSDTTYEATCACGPLTTLHHLADHSKPSSKRWYLLMRDAGGGAACIHMAPDWSPPLL